MKTRLLAREQLIKRLVRAVTSHQLTIVAAPMGYGKTVTAKALSEALGERAVFLDMSHAMQAKSRRIVSRSADAEPSILIVDNYQEHKKERVSQVLEPWTEAQPFNFHVVLFSRIRPHVRNHKTDTEESPVQFGLESLRFSESEALEYFAMHGIHDTEAVKDSWRRSEGWPAALWLALKNWDGGAGCQLLPDLKALLIKSVFADFTRTECLYLMRMSVFDDFSENEIKTLSGKNAVARFRTLAARGDIIEHDAETGLYRFHPLVRKFLTDELAAEKAVDLPALYRFAGVCCLDRNDLVASFRAFLRAGSDRDLTHALDLFLVDSTDDLLRRFSDEICASVQSIPWRIKLKRPLAYLSFIRMFLAVGGEARTAAQWLVEAESRFFHKKNAPNKMLQRIKGEVAIVAGLLAFNHMDTVWEKYDDALTLLQGSSSIRPTRLAWAFNNPHLSLACLREGGKFEDLLKKAARADKTLTILSGGTPHQGAMVLRIEYHLERGEFDKAEKLLEKIEKDFGDPGGILAVIAATFARARLYCIGGNGEKALEVLEQVRPQAEGGLHHHRENLELALGYVAASLGRYDSVPEWIRTGSTMPPYGMAQRRPFFLVAYGKALLASGDFKHLVTVARNMPLRFGHCDSLLGHIHAKVLEAIGIHRTTFMKSALARLRVAVDLSRGDGLVLPLAEYGGFIAPLLRGLAKEHPGDAHLHKILALAESISHFDIDDSAKQRKDLTLRETEIMRMIVMGKSNLQIGKELGIARETVKKQLISAYAKLGASNRIQASRLFVLHHDKQDTAE